MLAEELKQRAHKLEKIKKDAQELAAKLEGVSLKIATKVSSTAVSDTHLARDWLHEVCSRYSASVPARIWVYAV